MEFNLKFRNTKEDDYEEMKSWWKFFRFPVPPRHMLPDNLSDGMMVSHEDVNICSGFIYVTSASNLFWIEYIVSNHNVKDRKLRKEALTSLILGLKYMAKKMGAKTIFTSVVHPSLKRLYLDCGFVLGSSNADEMILSIE